MYITGQATADDEDEWGPNCCGGEPPGTYVAPPDDGGALGPAFGYDDLANVGFGLPEAKPSTPWVLIGGIATFIGVAMYFGFLRGE
jgi:hypothetical protein